MFILNCLYFLKTLRYFYLLLFQIPTAQFVDLCIALRYCFKIMTMMLSHFEICALWCICLLETKTSRGNYNISYRIRIKRKARCTRGMEKREQKNVITEARGLTSREYFPKLIILEISSFSSLEQNSYFRKFSNIFYFKETIWHDDQLPLEVNSLQ